MNINFVKMEATQQRTENQSDNDENKKESNNDKSYILFRKNKLIYSAFTLDYTEHCEQLIHT